MKNKKYLIGLAILVVATIAVMLIDRFSGTKKIDPRISAPLAAESRLLNVDKIIATKDQERIELAKDKDNIWTIASASGYPADAKKLAKFFDDFSKLTVQTLAAQSKSKFSELGMEKPLNIKLNTGDKTELEIFLGATRAGGGGQYVSIGNEDKVYLINQNVFFDLKDKNWELKTLFDFDKNKLKEVEFIPAKGSTKAPVKLSHEKAEDPFKVSGLKEDEKEREPVVKSLENIAKDFSFKDKYPLNDADAEKAWKGGQNSVKLTLFDGQTYELSLVSTGDKDKKKFFAKVLAAKNNASLDTATEKNMNLLNDLMTKWAFEVSSYEADKFIKGYDDYVEKKEEDPKKTAHK